VNAPPALTTGQITFGCLNNFSKVSAETLTAWKKILAAIPDSNILLHAPQGRHRQQLLESFSSAGIASQRIEFADFLPVDEYLRNYQRIDIALDPFPYTGGTTTLDAFWMNVPVVTLSGPTAVSRGGACILSNVGLTDLIATQLDQYAPIAISLASDRSCLAGMRSTLRDRLRGSPLMDATAFARDVESAYRRMWLAWCGGAPK
jgi:predicted O-linked N-acetylglucosamine transferase (SPINDLY family)